MKSLSKAISNFLFNSNKEQKTKEVKKQVERIEQTKWDSATETMHEYIERISKLRRKRK
jgi:23S rRNA A2030 N6-methylase RlmJ